MSMDNVYKNRLVKFENILNLTEEMFDTLYEVMDLQPGMVVLDAGAGYGAATRELIKRGLHLALQYHLVEQSHTQLERARMELAQFMPPEILHDRTAFFNHNLLQTYLPTHSYDRIVGKLLVHEIPQAQQPQLMRKLWSLLKPGGTLTLWQITLHAEVAHFYRNLIRKKDQLAGFKELEINRYFPEETELILTLREAGFANIHNAAVIPYELETIKRLHTDFKGKLSLLHQWNAYILEQYEGLSDKAKQQVNLRQHDENLRMDWAWGLYVASKPEA